MNQSYSLPGCCVRGGKKGYEAHDMEALTRVRSPSLLLHEIIIVHFRR